MASLTHVCMWSDKGWKHISAEEAAILHPGGTVSAYSGLFMCNLCGQYVTLVDGDYQVRHFRHSSREKSKDCPERTFGLSAVRKYDPRKHELPIRIANISETSFSFELGLIRAPTYMLNHDFTIEIKPNLSNEYVFKYTRERINSSGITFLSVGDYPAEKYSIALNGADKNIQNFWPAIINGVDPNGTLFEKDTGVLLSYDADVEIKKEYYLLRQRKLRNNCEEYGIHIKDISKKTDSFNTWYLSLIAADELNEDAAKFFLDLHYRLSTQPVLIQPVWPLFVEGSHLIKHNNDNIIFQIKGDDLKLSEFPSAQITKMPSNTETTNVYDIKPNSRQQLISIGRSKALKYIYFWKEPIVNEMLPPAVTVVDIYNEPVNPGITETLPKNNSLRFYSPYDGELVFYKGGVVAETRRVPANKVAETDKISYGMKIQFLVGLDCLWETEFVRSHPCVSSADDDEIYKYFLNDIGTEITAPHSLRNIAVSFKEYPKVYAWIMKCIKSSRINEQAYRKLQEIYLQIR